MLTRVVPGFLLVLLSIAHPLHAIAQTPEPPTMTIASEDFAPMRESWQPVTGRWSVSEGTYASTMAGGNDISIIDGYRDPARPENLPDSQLNYDEFIVRARVRNQGFTDDHLVGLVYQYQDPQNYYEVVVSALGAVKMRTVTNGIAVDEVPPVVTDTPRNNWLDLEVRWSNGVASLKIDGSTVYTTVQQPEFTRGQVGLITHAAVGRFDKVFIGTPFGDQGFLETFEEAPYVSFAPQSGQWAVRYPFNDGYGYYNTTVEHTNVSLAPIDTGVNVDWGETIQYTFRARLLNPYGGSGNLVGIVFNYKTTEYTEVVFSPTGIAMMRRFENGSFRTLATTTYNGRRNVPFDVTLENSPDGDADLQDGVVVTVDGQRIFEKIPDANPTSTADGRVGLITHWAPGRFDNVQFDHGVFKPCSFTFADPWLPGSIVSGTWNVNGGTLNNSSPGASDIVDLGCRGNYVGDDAGNNFVYSARLLNEYGNSGNLVGLVYNYQGPGSLYAGDYYEVVFSPTGVMRLNKFVQGVRTTIATSRHNVPRNTWFDVRLIRSGPYVSVEVNDTVIAQLIRQGSLTGGSIGVIAHWARARFDDVSLSEYVSLPP